MQTEFFAPMIPPTITDQMKRTGIRSDGSIYKYQDAELKNAQATLEAHLAKHSPATPYTDGVRLITKWCFPRGMHKDGEYRTTKPDTDNLQKMLKDVMTRLGFWKDDALVASDFCEKFWAEIPGIYIKIQPLSEIGEPHVDHR
jgi:Holliday junction resolvase RusA-like endonuclease